MPIFAADIKSTDGVTYKSAEITRVELDGITVSYADGVAKIPFTNLSPALQKKYGYDPAKLEAYRHEQIALAEAQQKAAMEAQRRQELALQDEQKKEQELRPVTPASPSIQSFDQLQDESAARANAVNETDRKREMGGMWRIAIYFGAIILFVCHFYYLPYRIAKARGSRHLDAILMLNHFAFFGICWLIALIWAYIPTSARQYQD